MLKSKQYYGIEWHNIFFLKLLVLHPKNSCQDYRTSEIIHDYRTSEIIHDYRTSEIVHP